jgi:DNA primase
MDMILLYQSGTKNVVATRGRRLTEEQIFNIKMIADKVILAFDSDKAGQKAEETIYQLMLNQQIIPEIHRDYVKSRLI